MGIIEAFLVFSVASLDFTVMSGGIRADLFVADVQEFEGLLKQSQLFIAACIEVIREFEAVVGLNTFHFDAFSLEFIDNPKQELVGRISGLFRISPKDSVPGVFINGSVLE